MDKKVLTIVDDEAINLSRLVSLFKDEYRIRAFKNSQSFLDALSLDEKPDLVLLDILLPDFDGYETLTKMKNIPNMKDVPVIFITAKDDPEDEEKGFKIGAVDYIRKPFMPTIVRERVRVQIELKQARQILNDKNAWLENEVRRRVNEISLIQDATINVLTQLVETRDTETGNHIIRTSKYIEILAKHLAAKEIYQDELTIDMIDRIIKASPLHDVGKLGIPDAILLKPGKLTPEEYEVIKKHCQYGADAIDNAIKHTQKLHPETSISGMTMINFLEVAKTIALSHHERWDGKGYPHALKENEIPLSAQMMALADVFDALTTPRVYKRAWTLEETSTYIKEQRGLQFAPDVVDAFIENYQEFEDIANRFKDE